MTSQKFKFQFQYMCHTKFSRRPKNEPHIGPWRSLMLWQSLQKFASVKRAQCGSFSQNLFTESLEAALALHLYALKAKAGHCTGKELDW